MSVFAAMKFVEPATGPVPYHVVYGSPGIRDQLLARILHEENIVSVDIAFSHLTDDELDRTVLLVMPKFPLYETTVDAYVTEKIARLRKKVAQDVTRAIAGATPDMVDAMTWVVGFSVAEATFSILIDGRGITVTLGAEQGKLEKKQLDRLIQKTIIAMKRAVMPELLRTIPRPPFLKG